MSQTLMSALRSDTKREPRPLSNFGRRNQFDGTLESFTIMEVKQTPRHVAKYDTERFEDERNRQLRDERHTRQAQKVFHRHNRSTSRVSASATKAEQKAEEIEGDIRQGQLVIQTFDSAVDAIDEAADQTRAKHGLANSSKICQVRRYMQDDAVFDASRGATQAANSINARFGRNA